MKGCLMWCLYIFAFFLIPIILSFLSKMITGHFTLGIIIGIALDAIIFWLFVKYLRRQRK